MKWVLGTPLEHSVVGKSATLSPFCPRTLTSTHTKGVPCYTCSSKVWGRQLYPPWTEVAVFPKKPQLSKEREKHFIRSQQDPVIQPKDKALETPHTVTASQSEHADELRAHTHTNEASLPVAIFQYIWIPQCKPYRIKHWQRESALLFSSPYHVFGEHMEFEGRAINLQNRGHPLPSFDRKTRRP